MTLWCKSQSSAPPPFATPLEESTLWKERRGTSTRAHSAPATVGGCCARPRCARRCSARTPHAPRTPAARSVQVTAPRPATPWGGGGCGGGAVLGRDPHTCGAARGGGVPTPVAGNLGRNLWQPTSQIRSLPSATDVCNECALRLPCLWGKGRWFLFLPFLFLNSASQETALLHQIIPYDFAKVKSRLCLSQM